MTAFDDLRSIAPRQIWEAIAGRVVEGEKLTLGVLELDPGAVAADHSHPNEQLGLVLAGSMTLRIGDETRELPPGSTYVIPGGTEHGATAGPDGAVVVDVFAPVREEWQGLESLDPRPPRWP